jgi:hypothetical protein
LEEEWKGFTELRLKPHMKGKWPSGKSIRKAVQRSRDFDKKEKTTKLKEKDKDKENEKEKMTWRKIQNHDTEYSEREASIQ